MQFESKFLKYVLSDFCYSVSVDDAETGHSADGRLFKFGFPHHNRRRGRLLLLPQEEQETRRRGGGWE